MRPFPPKNGAHRGRGVKRVTWGDDRVRNAPAPARPARLRTGVAVMKNFGKMKISNVSAATLESAPGDCDGCGIVRSSKKPPCVGVDVTCIFFSWSSAGCGAPIKPESRLTDHAGASRGVGQAGHGRNVFGGLRVRRWRRTAGRRFGLDRRCCGQARRPGDAACLRGVVPRKRGAPRSLPGAWPQQRWFELLD